MLTDLCGRHITCLRVSVTDRCNYRCIYCMPPEGVTLKPHGSILRHEEIAAIVAAGASLGIHKIKLTGGEPLIKRNLERLVGLIARVPGITDLGMTTNGSLLTPEKAYALKTAGLMRVNISLDTLDPGRFRRITRGGSVDDVLKGIDAALAAGLSPVKVNMVVFDDTADGEVDLMRVFCAERGVRLQTIRHFVLADRWVRGNSSISTDRPPMCADCNRLRLTADGFLKPCLHSDHEVKVDFNDIAAGIREAVSGKPREGSSCRERTMSQIGG